MSRSLNGDKIMTEKMARIFLREVALAKDGAIARGHNFTFVRDHYLFNLAYFTGLRISELSALKWGDVFEESEYLVVRKGKGAKSRTVIFGQKTAKLISEFRDFQKSLETRKCEPLDCLFIGQRGPLKPIGITMRMRYWVERLGFPKRITMHSWRHGFATRALDSGVPLSGVRDLLGHSSIAITSQYLWFTAEMQAKIKAIS